MISVGVDIEKINRFESLLPESSFIKKIFSPEEIKYCFSKKHPAETLAAKFAGKEAIIKALNGLNYKSNSYHEIEILNKNDNSPYVNLKNFLNYHISISLSHSDQYAIAFVLIFNK
ncbi:holo-ACP synthase [Nitrosopumilus maritimus]|uniref:4'-phosphopantetheinyl transferase n=1 Tax=Nitrosopumilus maritimus (strain SCM1) TaxID=436308 RepID=A9A1R7_NITMS|nr:holo-ACP synthase [Nitrosopumilus maritimus]ABX12038.1 4'-phosphopantetheinyl transferase [Nitrosopumilus maritimus SCM1]